MLIKLGGGVTQRTFSRAVQHNSPGRSNIVHTKNLFYVGTDFQGILSDAKKLGGGVN